MFISQQSVPRVSLETALQFCTTAFVQIYITNIDKLLF